MRKMLAATAIVLMFALGAPSWAWADFHRGLSTYSGDTAAALRVWRPMAEQGHAEARRLLGSMYFQGRGVTQDYVEAARWFRLAAGQGHFAAQFSLGFMYQHGQGLPRDQVEAAKWYGKSAEQGYAVAQEFLGAMYRHGLGVPKDLVQALKWFSIAALPSQPQRIRRTAGGVT